MELAHSLRLNCIEVNADCTSKEGVLRRIASVAKRAGELDMVSEDDIFAALEAREEVGSTGFEYGIAIPHCRLPGVTEFIAGLVTVPQGIDFDAMDGGDSTLLFFVIGPDDRNAYVRLLSNISQSVGTDSMRKSLLAATSKDAVYEALVGTKPKSILNASSEPSCTFQIVVQNEDRFTDILQAVSSVTDGIDVIETRGAGHYLHNLPIFATFWTSEETQFHRVILGVVSRSLVNELARSVNVAAGGLDQHSGVLLAVQDCLFCQGSLEA